MSLSLANNLTLLVNCESTTNWSGDNTLTTEASMAKQGTYAVGWNVDIETLTCKCDLTAERGSAQNLTNTVIYFWVYLVQPETTDGWDNGGVRLYLEDGSGNYSEWSVCGGGGGGSYRNYYGGYRRFAVDTSTTPDYVSGTLSISAVTDIGVTVKNTAKFKATEEIYVDYFAYHANSTYAITVTGGASAPRDFAELASQDASSGYGIFVEGLEGGPYYQVGPMRFNDTGSSALTFADTNQQITTYDTYRAFTTTNRTSAESLLTTGQYDWTITGNATGATSFTLGTKSGTEGISGCVVKQGNTSDPLINFDATNTNVNTFKIYGSTFIDIGTFKTPTTSATREVLSTVFSGCGLTTPDTCKFQYCKWVSSTGVAVLLSSTSHNLTDSQFIGSGTYAIKFSSTGTFTLDGVTFTGSTTADLENSNNATNTDSATVQDQAQQLDSTGATGTAQSITGDGGSLSNVVLKLRKVGSPTGNAVVKLYAHSGTFGTSSVPTGAALATSKNINVANLQTSLTDEKIDFDDSEFYTLVNATKYCIAIEYSGGDGSNYVEVGYDQGGAHGGNKSTYTSSWAADATDDLYFYVRTGGQVTISAQNDADPGTTAETGTPPGTTNINNEVTIQINVVKDVDGAVLQNAQCSIFLLDSPFTELMNEDSNASGVASEGYNYVGATDIKWRVRKSETTDNPRYQARSGTGQIGANGFLQTVRMKINTFI
jgi:hypothetical protein